MLLKGDLKEIIAHNGLDPITEEEFQFTSRFMEKVGQVGQKEVDIILKVLANEGLNHRLREIYDAKIQGEREL